MKVALVDPSLFTLPYDLCLADGLRQIGIAAQLYGRAPVAEDGGPVNVDIVQSFYKGSRIYGGLPAPLRLIFKGIDHGVSMLALLRRMRRAKPDIIHFQWFPLPILDGAFIQRLQRIAPVVITVHDTNPFNGDPAAGLQRLGFSAVLRQCDRLIVHTSQGRTRLTNFGIDRDRIDVLPHGPLGTASLDPADDNVTEPLNFALFGKIKPYKGADVLIEAFAALPSSLRQKARVRIIGQSYMDLAPLRQLANTYGLTEMLTIEDRFVADDEVSDIFGRNVVAVFPYREIEASGVLSLALAHSRPIIASNLGLFAESLTDGVHGRLVAPGDTAALSAAMAQMIEKREFTADCANNVATLAKGLPDWTDIAHRTAALYAACLRDRASALQGQTGGLTKEAAA